MTITRTITQVYVGPSAAGQILAPTINVGGLGVPAAMAGTFSTESIFGGDSLTAGTTSNGYRVEEAMDLSTRKYVGICAAYEAMFLPNLATYADGGIRITFQDGSGNWAAYTMTGSDVGQYRGGAESAFASYNGFAANDQSTSITWWIERDVAPIYSSGVLDWSDIAAYEIHFRYVTATRGQIAVGRFVTSDIPTHTGTASSAGVLPDITEIYGYPGSGLWSFPWVAKKPTLYFQGAAQQPTYLSLGLQIGDGSTPTTVTINNRSLTFAPLWEDNSATFEVPNSAFLLTTPRLIDIFQSATDNVTLSDCLVSTTRLWGIVVRGSTAGISAMPRNQFVKYSRMELGHSTPTDSLWDGGTAPIQVTADTVITRGTVRNATAGGLTIVGAPGNYATKLDATFSGNALYDIAMGSGGAGAYILTGAKVNSGYTLKLHNNSATNGITVEIAAGVATSTTTAGGAVTVVAPAVYQSVTVTGFPAGSRVQIYDTTNSVALFNGTASGSDANGSTVVSGTSAVWTASVPAAVSRAIRVRVSYVSGVTANEFIEVSGLTCATAGSSARITYPVASTADSTYNSNGIDGPSIYATSGITFTDAVTDLVNCNIAGGSVTWATIYACFVYWSFTSTGIANDFTYIAAPDTANYLLSSMKIRNTSAVDLMVIGGYGRDATTGLSKDIIDTLGSTGNIFLAPDHVVPYQTTGTYAITGDISTVLSAIPPAGVTLAQFLALK
jgi:hypothetical protein